jgi:WD40 repeat protein/serine/threonine protein kinase
MIGQKLGHYRIVERIGAGGMGVVYRANDQHLERDVALKVLPPGFIADQAARKRFRREALALSKLNHPNIATIFDFDTQDGVDFLAMELISGTPLSSQVKVGPLPEKEILRLGIQLTEGLVAAHAQGVIHRDLKPGNLIVTCEGRLKILDFGLAVLVIPKNNLDATRTLTEATPVEGTLPYMSPEQLLGQPVDVRSDVYSAGAVLYEMATGNRPFHYSQSAELIGAILHETPPPPRSLNQQVTPALEIVILKTLQKEPGGRYQSAAELRVALEEQKNDLPVNIVGGQRPSSPRPGPKFDPYATIKALPLNYVSRPDLLEPLRALILGAPISVAVTALDGMGGIGKTELARALCHDPQVRATFPDGITWVDVGKESGASIHERMAYIADSLNEDSSGYNNINCEAHYRTLLNRKKVLIVLDDVWSHDDVEPFRPPERSYSRLLFTTREAWIAASIGAQDLTAELLSADQAFELLAKASGQKREELPGAASDIVCECGRSPLALSQIGGALRGKPEKNWQYMVDNLREARHLDILSTTKLSIDALDDTTRGRYLRLAVLLEDTPATVPLLQTLWQVDERGAYETMNELVNRSLARYNGESSIYLHDLQLDYIRSQHPDRQGLSLIHQALRLSGHVVRSDAQQFASQIVGRLLSYSERKSIRFFLDCIRGGAPRPWLLPRWPVLSPPGGPLLCMLEGHAGGVLSVALSAEGRRALSTSRVGILTVWEVETGEKLRVIECDRHNVSAGALSADGCRIIAAFADGSLKVWDVDTGSELQKFFGHDKRVIDVALSSDGRRAVSASGVSPSAYGSLKVWDVDSGRELRTLDYAEVSKIALSADGRRVVSGFADGTLKVWDVDTGRELQTFVGHEKRVFGVALSGNGRRAVSAFGDTLRIWDVDSGSELRRLVEGATSVALTSDGRRVGVASWDKTLKIWDVDSGRELSRLTNYSQGPTFLAMSANGRRLLSASWDKMLNVWDMESGHALHMNQPHAERVTDVAVSGDRRLAVSASMDKTLKVWDVDTGRELRSLVGHGEAVTSVALSADGRRALSASADHTLRVWDVDTGRETRILVAHRQGTIRVALSADGRLAVSASFVYWLPALGTLKVWDVETGNELRTLADLEGITDVALSADGRRAISGTCVPHARAHTNIKIWDIETGREMHTLERYGSGILALAMTADGRRAVWALADGTLKVCDVESGRDLYMLEGYGGDVVSMSLSADGRHAVLACSDNVLRVWDVERGESLANFTCDVPPTCCAFVDDRSIVAGDDSGRIHLLTLEV